MTPRTCIVDDCDGRVRGLGACNKHYLRFVRFGSHEPDHMPRQTTEPGHKTCKKCRQVKPHSDFKRVKDTKDGRRGSCLACARARAAELYQLNKATRVPWIDRFLDRQVVDDRTGCWDWTGDLNPYGYGRMRVAGANWMMHRLSYALHHGDLPTDALICHHCDNRRCVNPAHLYAGTPQSNVDDMWSRGRQAQARRGAMTRTTVPTVRAMYAAGASRQQLAEEFGVTKRTISDVVSRRTWKRVA